MTGNIQYENDLNEAQYEAVTTLEGSILVIAGAGSGKTRTLTYRVARLVDQGVPPDRILLLTFTRKASEEMLRRAGTLLDRDCAEAAGGTFHSFAHLTLRRYAPALGFSRDFVILDRSDCEALTKNIKNEIVPKGLRGFPKNRTITSMFSRASNTGMDMKGVIFDEYRHFIPHIDILEDMYQAYAIAKTHENLMDFDDLLLHLRVLLQTEEEVRLAAANRYDYIMVDEYQDTNLIQADILRYLGAGHGNVMVVGDDCQSIYGFRGANFENIMRFPEVFKDTKVIRLEENYRSTQPLLDVTNSLVKQAKRKYTKKLFTSIGGGVPPSLVKTYDENAQSRFVVDEIQRLIDEGVELGEIAVLFRAGYLAFDLEVELAKSGINYVKFGGFKFMESAHIKDLLVHLRAAARVWDRLSWERVFLLLPKVGPKTAKTLAEKVSSGLGMASIKPAPSYAKAVDVLKDLYQDLDRQGQTVAVMGKLVLDYYQPYLEKTYDNWPKRMKDLEQLLSMMDRYGTDLEGFLNDVTLEPPTTAEDDVLAPNAKPHGRVVLSTIHSSKGLEWKAVFVIWTLDGRFPSKHAVEKGGDAIEEELRLMYVAATRAKEELFFVHPTDIYDPIVKKYLFRPSRFLETIPQSSLRRLSL